MTRGRSPVLPNGDLVTVTLYNADGQVTDLCPPRELAEGAADNYVCNSTSTYATHTTYNAAGWIASTQLPGVAHATTYGYDADGNKTTITNADLYATTYVYSVLDRMSSMTVPRDSTHSYTTTYGYDPSGDETYQYQPIDGTNLIRTEYTYDADHRVIDSITGASVANSTAAYSATNGTDVRTRNAYDADGNVVEQYQPNAFTASGTTPDTDYAIGATYNADNERTAVYTPRYDTATHTPSLTDPVGSTQTPTQSNDCPTGGVSGFGYASTLGICTTSYQYDPDGNTVVVNWPTQTSTDRHPVTTSTYTNTNLVLTETDPNPDAGVGGTVTAATYAYDAEGKQTDQTDANGISTQTTYTADELVEASTQTPNGTTTHITSYLYDANGERVQLLDAIGNATQTTYYPNGLTESVTDAMGDETSYVYDAVGNPTQVTSPDANAKAAANPNGTPTYNVYTEDNLLEATLIPDNSTDKQRAVCYAYDQSGRKTGQGHWLNTGTVITTEPSACGGGVPSGSFGFTNLPDGRLSKETGRNGTSTLSFTYDADGNQLTSTDSTSSITTTDTYYADDLLRTAADGENRTTNYAYDGLAKVTGRNSVPTSGTTYTDTITYNDADLQSSETDSVSSTTTNWLYDAGGRLVQTQNANGDLTDYSYASDGTLAEEIVSNTVPPIDTVADFVQTMDGDYQVTSDGCSYCSNTAGTASVGHTFTYQYDAAGRLIFIEASGGGAAAFQTYDQDGNRITHDDVTTDAYTNYTYNADNSIATTILSGTSVSSTYNLAGVLTSDGCKAWTLDTFDRATTLAAVGSPPSVCPAAPPTTTYKFDANGSMLTETVSSTTTTIHHDLSTSTPIVETTSGTNTAYVLDSGGVPIEAAQGSTAVYTIDDPKGDLSTVMASSGNWPTCQLQFDPYGTPVFPLSAANPCENGSTFDDLLYQNGRVDSSSGDYQLGPRTYDPSKNSFLSPDHFQTGTSGQDLSIQVDPLTENAYEFVDGDPVNRFDPTGHMFTTGTEGMGGDQACSVCHTYATAETGKTRAQVSAIRTADVRHDDAANAAYKAAEQRKTAAAAAAAAATAASAARPGFQDGPKYANYVPGEGDCEYTGDGQVVCPDYAGNYDLTSSQYESCPGCAPGDPQPQRTTWGDVVTGGSILLGIAGLPFGEGEAQLPAELAWLGTDSVTGAATEGVSLADRAAAVQSSLSGVTADSTTTAALRALGADGQAQTIIATSESSFRSSWLAVLQDGEIGVAGPDDAEINALNAARQLGLNPVQIAASRPVCLGCQLTLQQAGVTISSPLKYYGWLGWPPAG